MLTIEQLKTALHYDPETGVFTWLISRGRKPVGSVAGPGINGGYSQITIFGYKFYASRLAWFYMKGVWPKQQIDHINRIRSDDRFRNLREASHAQNMANRNVKSKNLRGTRLHKKTGHWEARISVNSKRIYLGVFATEGEAHAAYQRAAERYHGEFSGDHEAGESIVQAYH